VVLPCDKTCKCHIHSLHVNKFVPCTAEMVVSHTVFYFIRLPPLNKAKKQKREYIRKARNPTAFHFEGIIMTVKCLHVQSVLFLNLEATLT